MTSRRENVLDTDIAEASTESPDATDRRFAWPPLAQLASVLAQLGLAALVIRYFQLESRSFYKVFLLAIGSFVVHALLPARMRLAFFAAASFAAIAMVFGLRNGALLVGAGLLLIGACHLPVRLGVRVGVILVMAGAFALSRSGMIPSLLPSSAWAILGSMFMFRLAIYLHALENDAMPRNAARTLSYFFMLPNVCYPLFPVVDYATFARTWYDADAGEIYQRGTKWIARGLVHLLLYRFVYLHLSIDITEIHGFGDVVQSLLATFLLYLRISGQFHLIVGMLHLFGFHLPETHRLYYLASSISDYWRRINIYWKDFMMKLVFYPGFFRLRRRGERFALVVSTMAVFVATWVLHSYQWFWLRSVFPVTPQDILFWSLLGALVVVNSLREMGRARTRPLKAVPSAWSASLALRTAGTFAVLCALWSLWSADSVVDWLWMWTQVTHVTMRDVAVVGGLLAVGLAIAGRVWDAPVVAQKGPIPFYKRSDVRTTAVLGALLALRLPAVQAHAGGTVAGVFRTLQTETLNTRDRALQQRGYYERLDNRGRLSAQLWNVVDRRPPGLLPLSETIAYHRIPNDFLGYDLAPNTEALVMGKTVTTNRWGMRDIDYSREKPSGTKRIALLGPSYTMGSGVTDDETYDAFLEAELNADSAARARYQVLNFGVAAYSLLHQMRLLDTRVYDFQPDVVVITDSRQPEAPIVQHMIKALADGSINAYPELRAIAARAGVKEFPGAGLPVPTSPLRFAARAVGIRTRIPEREASLRINAALEEIYAWSFRHMAEAARRHGAVPVFVDGMFPNDLVIADSPMMRAARDAGFLVISIAPRWVGQPRNELRIGSWDMHPNARAMRMIADDLVEEFRRHDTELHLALRRASP